MESLALDWEVYSREEKRLLSADLLNATPGLKKQEVEEGGRFKVDFETVPELMESRNSPRTCGKPKGLPEGWRSLYTYEGAVEYSPCWV